MFDYPIVERFGDVFAIAGSSFRRRVLRTRCAWTLNEHGIQRYKNAVRHLLRQNPTRAVARCTDLGEAGIFLCDEMSGKALAAGFVTLR